MAKKSDDKQLPDPLEMSAGDLVKILIEEAGESFTSLSVATGVDRGSLSRYRSKGRVANEVHYRSLVKYAISQKVACFR